MYQRIYTDFGLFLVLLAIRIGVSIWLFGEIYARVHDNLDSMVVYSAVAAEFWTSWFDPAVFDRFIGGASQWYHYTQPFSPQTLAYVIFDVTTAYLVLEIMGIVIAYWGMLKLLREVFGRHAVLQVLACLFAFSISFHSFGLGLSGAPLVLWWALRQKPVGAVVLIGAFAVGLSTAFAIHGLFVPVVFALVGLIIKRPILTSQSIAVLGVYFLGCLLASSGLIYATLFDPPSQRDSWIGAPDPLDLFSFVQTLATGILEMNMHYAAIYLPGILAPFVLLAGFVAGRWKVASLILVVIAVTAALRITAPYYRTSLPGPFSSIQYDRLGQFNVILLIILAAIVVVQCRHRIGRFLCWAGIVIYGFVAFPQSIGLNPNIVLGTISKDLRVRGVQAIAQRDFNRLSFDEIFGGDGISRQSMRSARQTVTLHFMPDLYDCFRNALPEGARVLSVGVDPMIAPLNGIAAIDGYHNYYPLSYKLAFRKVIQEHLALNASRRAYYDNWGNRVDSFVDQQTVSRLDLEAAKQLGANYVISAFEMDLTPAGGECFVESGPYLFAMP